jgi:hypothetical protein
MEEGQRLTLVQGVVAMGVYIRSFLFLSFSLLVFNSVVLLFNLSILIYISLEMKR